MGKIIGIGGVSRAGKTSLAQYISEWFDDKTIKILHQDEFIVPKSDMPFIKNQIDWERPEIIDFVSFRKEILKEKEQYDYIIAEGLLVYHNPEVFGLFDKKIFLKISKETFLNRKTLDYRWENEPDWYIQHIWNSHFVYGTVPSGSKDVLCMTGENQFKSGIIKNYILE